MIYEFLTINIRISGYKHPTQLLPPHITWNCVQCASQRSVNKKIKIPSHSWCIAFRYQVDTGSLNDTKYFYLILLILILMPISNIILSYSAPVDVLCSTVQTLPLCRRTMETVFVKPLEKTLFYYVHSFCIMIVW